MIWMQFQINSIETEFRHFTASRVLQRFSSLPSATSETNFWRLHVYRMMSKTHEGTFHQGICSTFPSTIIGKLSQLCEPPSVQCTYGAKVVATLQPLYKTDTWLTASPVNLAGRIVRFCRNFTSIKDWFTSSFYFGRSSHFCAPSQNKVWKLCLA